MKRIVIPVVIFLLVLATLIGYGVGRSTSYMTYQRQCSDHLINAAQNGGENIAEDTDGTRTWMTYSNINAFLNAVTRTETEPAFFVANLKDMPCVTVTFSDGGVIEVFDAGEKDGDDLAYIRHSWKNRTMTFRLLGYNTFERVCKCISLSGYNEPNYPYSSSDD